MDCDNDMSNQPGSQNGMNTAPSQSLCRVCGIDNAQVHYGALCCVSCKMFFRRNAQLNLVSKSNVSIIYFKNFQLLYFLFRVIESAYQMVDVI